MPKGLTEIRGKMAEEEAIKASSTRPAAAAGSASGSSTKPMVDKKATANPANMSQTEQILT